MTTFAQSTSRPQLDRRWFAIFAFFLALLVAAALLVPSSVVYGTCIGIAAGIFLVFIGLYPWIVVPGIIITTGLDITGRLVKDIGIGIPLTGFHAALGLMLIGIAVNTFGRRRTTFPEFELKGPLALLLGVMAISLTYTPALADGTIGLMRTLCLVIFLYGAQVMIDSRRAINLVLISMAVALVFGSTMAIVQITTEQFFLPASFVIAVGANAPRAVGTFHNPNTFGTFMMCGTVLLFGVLVNCPLSRWNRLLVFLPLAIGATGLVVTFSRSNWVAAMAGGVVALAMARKLRYVFYVGIAAFGAVLVVKEFVPFADHIFARFVSIFTIVENFGDLGRESSSVRVYFIIAGLMMWLDHPLLGAGWRAFPVLFDDYKPVDFPYWVPTKESHTMFAGILAELGLIGFLASVWVVWRTLQRGFAALPGIEDEYIKGVLISLLSVFVAFQVSLTFTADFSNNFLWFFTGMTFAVISFGRNTQTGSSQ